MMVAESVSQWVGKSVVLSPPVTKVARTTQQVDPTAREYPGDVSRTRCGARAARVSSFHVAGSALMAVVAAAAAMVPVVSVAMELVVREASVPVGPDVAAVSGAGRRMLAVGSPSDLQ